MTKSNEQSAKDRIKFALVEDADSATKFADLLMEGVPLCLDFRNCPDSDGNQVLYFLEGVNYATDGVPIIMKPKVFLFITKKDLKDPTIKDFLDKYKEAA